MHLFKSLFLLVPAVLFSEQLVVTPANPVAAEGGVVTVTASKPAFFSLSGVGALTSSSGLTTSFIAPPTITPQHTLAGCMVTPSDSVFNTRIDKLPVHSASLAWTPFATSNGISMVYGWGTNIIDNTTPTALQTFHYSTQLNGAAFPQIAQPSRKRETGSYTSDSMNDHHMVSVNRNTCQFFETYQDGIPVSGCPSCTAASGWTYSAASYILPNGNDGGGSTDAAGLPLAPLTLHLSELQTGAVNHALRFTACAGCISRDWMWPAATSTGAQPGAPPMGARFRLKTDFNITGFPPAAQTVLKALKQYGMLLADIGMSGQISASSDISQDPEIVKELSTLQAARLNSSNFEIVDESSFQLSPSLSAVNPNNPYQKPANSAVLTVTDAANPASSVQIPIAIQPILVGTPEPSIVVQAGTPAFQISSWVTGSANQRVIWLLSPGSGLGTVSNGGIYTAPDDVPGIANATLTGWSNADPHQFTRLHLTIIPAGAVRIDAGSSVSTIDSSGNLWLPDLAFETGGFQQINDDYPAGNWGPLANASIWQSYMYTWGDDILYKLHVPNGTYKISLMFGIGEGNGVFPTTPWDNGLVWGKLNLQSQGTLVFSDWDLGAAVQHRYRTPATVSFPAVVTDTNLTVAVRAGGGNLNHSVPLLNGLVIEPQR